jgi:hypothetical protein
MLFHLIWNGSIQGRHESLPSTSSKALFHGNYITGGTFNVHVASTSSAESHTTVSQSPKSKGFRRLLPLESIIKRQQSRWQVSQHLGTNLSRAANYCRTSDNVRLNLANVTEHCYLKCVETEMNLKLFTNFVCNAPINVMPDPREGGQTQGHLTFSIFLCQ